MGEELGGGEGTGVRAGRAGAVVWARWAGWEGKEREGRWAVETGEGERVRGVRV